MPAAIWPRCCRVCGALANLVPNKARPGGVQTICGDCLNGERRRRRRSRQGNQAETASRKRWLERNRDQQLVAYRECQRSRRANPDQRWVAVGNAVKAWRKANRVTQAELGKLLGVTQNAISDREAGINAWPAADLVKLRRAGAAIPEDALP